MEQLTLEQAANNYHFRGHIDNVTDLEYHAFKAGAEWQQQKYNIKAIIEVLELGRGYMQLYMKKSGQNLNATPEQGSALDKINKALELLQD